MLHVILIAQLYLLLNKGGDQIIVTLIFLVGEMPEKFLWRSDYIFRLSLMPENQSSKKFSILTSRFEGQVQHLAAITAHLPNGPYT